MREHAAPAIRFCIRAKVAECNALDGKWWLRIEDSWEGISLGPVVKEKVADKLVDEPPPLLPGEAVNLVIERVKA